MYMVGLAQGLLSVFSITLISPTVQVLCQYSPMPQTGLAFLVEILVWHLLLVLNFTFAFEQNPRLSEKLSGKFALNSLFSFSVLVDNRTVLLQNVFVGTLNLSNASIQSVPKRFGDQFITNAFIFFYFPEKKTFVTISPKNFNLPPVNPLAIFFRSN